jgi:hypothetical protein
MGTGDCFSKGIKDWLGPRAGIEVAKKRKNLVPVGE